jgi:hypothetical protein
MLFSPSVRGTAAIRAQEQSFIAAFTRRIETGLLRGAPKRRCHYLVTGVEPDWLAFRAADWWTAFYVGLNEVTLKVFPDGRVRYTIRYPRWAGYAVALGAALAIILVAFFLTFDLRSYIASHAASRIPGLTLDQNVAIAWAMAVFWGFAWPWILIPLHKRPLRRLMEQIIGEVDAAASEARPRV